VPTQVGIVKTYKGEYMKKIKYYWENRHTFHNVTHELDNLAVDYDREELNDFMEEHEDKRYTVLKRGRFRHSENIDESKRIYANYNYIDIFRKGKNMGKTKYYWENTHTLNDVTHELDNLGVDFDRYKISGFMEDHKNKRYIVLDNRSCRHASDIDENKRRYKDYNYINLFQRESKPEEEEPKFKVGDSVRIRGNSESVYTVVSSIVSVSTSTGDKSTLKRIYTLNDDKVVMQAIIKNDNGSIVATGTAYEKSNSTFINKTSYIENCETSAWGRALGNLGIGLDESVASADEVLNATHINKYVAEINNISNIAQLKEYYDKHKGDYC